MVQIEFPTSQQPQLSYSIVVIGRLEATAVFGAIERAIERASQSGFVFDAKAAVRMGLDSHLDKYNPLEFRLGDTETEVLLNLKRLTPTSYRADIAYLPDSDESDRAASIIFTNLAREVRLL